MKLYRTVIHGSDFLETIVVYAGRKATFYLGLKLYHNKNIN